MITNCTLFYVYGNDEHGYFYRYKAMTCNEDGTFCFAVPDVRELSVPIEMRYRTIPAPLKCYAYLVSCIDKREEIDDKKCWFLSADFDNNGTFSGIVPTIKENQFYDRFPTKGEFRVMDVKVILLYFICILLFIFALTRI